MISDNPRQSIITFKPVQKDLRYQNPEQETTIE